MLHFRFTLCSLPFDVTPPHRTLLLLLLQEEEQEEGDGRKKAKRIMLCFLEADTYSRR